MNSTNAIIPDVKNLAIYINNKHIELKNEAVSPIKLQKSMYFCLAYWGAFIREAKPNGASRGIIEADYSDVSEVLFDAKIEAWKYGPVIPEIFKIQGQIINSEIAICDLGIVSNQNMVIEFLNDLLHSMFKVSDFTLVDISHSDEAWKQKYDVSDQTHNQEISIESIISEYAGRK